MHTMRLRTFINTPQGTSGGASLIDSTKPCPLSPFLVEDLHTQSVLSVVHDYPGGVRIKLEVESTGDGPLVLPKDAVIRLLCHGFLEWLPSEALDDVWENISDAWEWHSRPALPVPTMEGPVIVLDRIFDPVEEKPFTLTEE